MRLPSLGTVADRALEATIVGSFTKLGYQARSRLFDWDPPDADLGGQLAIVTGATSGLGRATAAGLLRLGADVWITSRSQERAERAATELEHQPDARGHATGVQLDTSDLDSVRALVARVAESGRHVDVLVNNAGALTSDRRTDGRGMELTLSSHLVGPYLLVKEMRPHLVRGARVLFMASGGMYTQGLDVDRIEMGEDEYRGTIAYARAKRGQVELVAYLGPRWAPEVRMHSVHPGWAATAGVDAGIPGFGKVMGPLLRSADQGADTMVWLAAGGAADEAPGQFWLDREPRGTVYLPGTGTDDAERRRLVEWLDEVTSPSAPSA